MAPSSFSIYKYTGQWRISIIVHDGSSWQHYLHVILFNLNCEPILLVAIFCIFTNSTPPQQGAAVNTKESP